MTAFAKRPYLLLALCVSLTVLIFVVDLQVPRGVSDSIAYVAVVLLALWFREPRYPIYFAVAGCVLTWVGYWGSPPGEELWPPIANRVLTTLAIAATAILSLQKRRAEQALRAVEVRAQAILDTTTDAVVTFDGEGRVTGLNPAAVHTFGFATREPAGQQVVDLIAPAHRAGFQRLLVPGGAAHAPRPSQVEVLGQRQDGEAFPAEVCVVRLEGEEQFTMTARDISERRRLEQEILKMSDRERTRIGHDLQEGLGQMLTGIGLINRSLASRLQAEQQPYAEDVAQVTELIREADQYTRGLGRGLVPVDLDASGLAFALRRLADEARQQWGVACTFEEEGEVLVHDNTVATHLYRIAQEAVHEAAVERKATRVAVTLSAGPPRLRVEDDGRVPPAGDGRARPDGFGLAIMRYRANLIGATLDVEHAGGGTMILACILPAPKNGRG